MADTKTATQVDQIACVCVPTTDADRSLEFYVGTLGMEKRVDLPFGGSYRWVEVAPEGATTPIALAPPREGDPVGVETGIALRTDDIDALHAELKDAGVDCDDEVSRMGEPVPPMFFLRDPDGNKLFAVEREN